MEFPAGRRRDTYQPLACDIRHSEGNHWRHGRTGEFLGLAPTLVGIYVVNVLVPDTVSPGDNIPVMLTISGLTSNTVTISIR